MALEAQDYGCEFAYYTIYCIYAQNNDIQLVNAYTNGKWLYYILKFYATVYILYAYLFSNCM